ncbi:MAG TPA: herpeto-tandem family RiPP [Herpetosiphonaceae bacterium]
MERTLSTAQASSAKSTPEHAPIFGLYYLEEHEFDLNEVVGCFGASAVDANSVYPATFTCPTDDADGGAEVP